jgi:hypothetical protein
MFNSTDRQPGEVYIEIRGGTGAGGTVLKDLLSGVRSTLTSAGLTVERINLSDVEMDLCQIVRKAP